MGTAASPGRRRFWGWGLEGAGPSRVQHEQMAATLGERFGLGDLTVTDPPAIDELELRPPRLTAPPSLGDVCTAEPYERAAHTYGKSFRDVARALGRDFRRPPDLVALPRDEGEVGAVLDWCAGAGAAAIPYGGGSSVVGGVECDVGDEDRPVVSMDLRHLDRVLEVDRVSRAARVQAGILGPALEDRLRPDGLTLRHFPQSFEFSSLGGWIATRSGGHYATLYTHIDDFVESMRAVTPRGILESRRLPGSGAGPSPDRLMLGSEGILGVITEAWMRLQDRPRHRASFAAHFATFEAGAAAARALAQAGLFPANCRLIESTEALLTGAGDGRGHLLLVAFESADHPLDPWLARAAELARDHAGLVDDDETREGGRTGGRGEHARGSARTWRASFLRAPYTRDALVGLGLLNETFETAVTWDGFDDLHARVVGATREAIERVGAEPGIVTCRFTHVYPDGPAPYFTVIARGAPALDERLAQWGEIKRAASEAILGAGGTITHHHAVGRDHRPWYDHQRPPLFADALRAAKRALDPGATLNPGVLVDP